MTTKEIAKAIEAVEAVLPDGWSLKYVDMESGALVVNCPIEDRFEGDEKTFDRNVTRIAIAAHAKYDGGGAMVGSDLYDNFFFFDK